MSDSPELSVARRNLLVISSILLIIEVTGAKIESINAPGVSITVARPELIIYFLYAVLTYSLFRFWQLAKTSHQSHQEISIRHINRTPYITTIIAENKDDINNLYLSDSSPYVDRKIFKRTLFFSGDVNGHNFQKRSVELSYRKIFIHEVIADIKSISSTNDFIEYTFPRLYAYAICMGKVVLVLLTKIH